MIKTYLYTKIGNELTIVVHHRVVRGVHMQRVGSKLYRKYPKCFRPLE